MHQRHPWKVDTGLPAPGLGLFPHTTLSRKLH